MERYRLRDSKFPHLTFFEFMMSEFQEHVDYFHESFQRVLSNSYERGIIWLRIHATGMFIFILAIFTTSF